MNTSERPFDVMEPDCPSRVVLQRIGDKWTPLVFHALKAGPRRFSAIRTSIQGVTPKVLTQTLRTLERDGLVARTVYAQVPPRVEYRLTPLGQGIAEKVEALVEWIEGNVPRVLKAREKVQASASR